MLEICGGSVNKHQAVGYGGDGPGEQGSPINGKALFKNYRSPRLIDGSCDALTDVSPLVITDRNYFI